MTARERDVIWDTLVELFGVAPAGMERGRWNKACQSLKESGATPDSLRSAAAEYRRHPSYSRCVMTPTALACNWTILTGTPRSAREIEGDLIAARVAERESRYAS